MEHAHLERLGPLRDGAADPAKADDAQRRAADLPAEKVRVGPAAAPAAVPHGAVAGHDPPSDRKQQREREIGGGGRQHAGRIRDHDAPDGAGVDIDRVVAGAVVRDDSQDREQVERLVIDPFAEDGERLDVVPPSASTFRKRLR